MSDIGGRHLYQTRQPLASGFFVRMNNFGSTPENVANPWVARASGLWLARVIRQLRTAKR